MPRVRLQGGRSGWLRRRVRALPRAFVMYGHDGARAATRVPARTCGHSGSLAPLQACEWSRCFEAIGLGTGAAGDVAKLALGAVFLGRCWTPAWAEQIAFQSPQQSATA